jgi:hypothetical protein
VVEIAPVLRVIAFLSGGVVLSMGRVANFPSSWSADAEAFVLSAEHRPNNGPASENDDIPVISLTPLFDALGAEFAKSDDWAAVSARVEQSEDPALRSLVAAIGSACAEWGFFQVIDHEVPPALLRKVKSVAKGFFTLPLEEKHKIGRGFDQNLGYNNSELTKNTRDWKEIFDWAVIGYMEMPETVESDYRYDQFSNPSSSQYAHTSFISHLSNITLTVMILGRCDIRM